MRTETTVRHTKCGRMREMVVAEGGRSSGVLLYGHSFHVAVCIFLSCLLGFFYKQELAA